MAATPELAGSGFVLRPWRCDEASRYLATRDPTVLEWTNEDPELDLDGARELIQSALADPSMHLFAIVDPDSGEPIGAAPLGVGGTTANGGYWLTPAGRGRGLAAAVLGRLADWLPTIGVTTFELHIALDNLASSRTAERAGFQLSRADVDGMQVWSRTLDATTLGDATLDDIGAWDRMTAEVLEDAYVERGAGPRGSGAGSASEGEWRAKRQHLAIPMDRDGSWLDVGCANGHLMATLPLWAAERDVAIEAHGLELLPRVADLARLLHPELADRIHTGSVMTWDPTRRYRYVTALEDAVPPHLLSELIERLLSRFVEPGGRLILSSYANRDEAPRALFEDMAGAGFAPDGRIAIDRPGRQPLRTAWLDAPG